MKKSLLAFIFLFCFSHLAYAQSTATPSQIGTLTTSGCPGGRSPCFIPISSTNPLSVSVGTSSITGVLPVANGGTGLSTLGSASQCLQVNGGATALTYGSCGSAGGVTSFTGDSFLLNNSASTGVVTATLANHTANTVIGALTATTPSDLAVPSCSASTSALTWTSGTGFGCHAISAGGTPSAPLNSVQFNSASAFAGDASFIYAGNGSVSIGTAGHTGSVALLGTSSGTVTLTPQATAGTPTVTFGTSSGTPMVTVSAPLALNTTTGNGSITGAAGQILAGSTPAFTATPTLGVNTSTTGQLILANGGGSGASVTLQNNGATSAYNFNLPTTAGTVGQLLASGGGSSSAMTWASGGPVLNPSSSYTSDTLGNLTPGTYTGAGGNASPTDSGWNVAASLGADPVLQLRFKMPSRIPAGTFKLVSTCQANATSGVVKYTVSDADVATGSSPSAASLSAETQTSITWTAVDIYVATKTTLTSTPSTDDYSVVAITFNHTGWTLAQILTCTWSELWE